MNSDAPTRAIPALPPAITITIDRVPLESDVDPYYDHGSLLVPARAIFTALGADVKFDAATGHILATRGNRIVSLHLGRTDGEVGGHAVTLAAPPQVVNARMLVPLRFVTEAFGGVATFDAATNTVAITGASPIPSAKDPQALGTAEAYAGVLVVARHPAPGEVVNIALPAISGDFQTRGGPDIDPDSVRFAIDGVDETGIATRSGSHFGFTPSQPLAPGEHEIDVNGLDRSATPFDIHWSFSVAQNATYEPDTMTLQTADAAADGVVDTIEYDEDPDGAFGLDGPYAPGAGGVVRFAYAGPPGGSGYVTLCGYAPTYPMYFDPASHRYLASVVLPPDLYAPNCYVTGTFVSAGGVTHTLPLLNPIPIDTTGTFNGSRGVVRAAPIEPRRVPAAPVAQTPGALASATPAPSAPPEGASAPVASPEPASAPVAPGDRASVPVAPGDRASVPVAPVDAAETFPTLRRPSLPPDHVATPGDSDTRAPSAVVPSEGVLTTPATVHTEAPVSRRAPAQTGAAAQTPAHRHPNAH